jgi:hypothetical protein
VCRVSFRGLPYEIDLIACRRALVDRQVDGDFDSMEGLADAIEMSRSTASRFFSGRSTSLAVTKKIVKRLGLEFRDVVRLAQDGEDSNGTAGGAPPSGPTPGGPTSHTHQRASGSAAG